MYKLLVTTALVAITATSASANEWTGGKALVQDLETIYQNLDGQTHFDSLQGNNGALNNFFSEVDKGVTHLTLKVTTKAEADADLTGNTIANTIIPTLVEGSSFAEIQSAATGLVNRVNYDLFTDVDPTNFNAGTDYVVIGHNITGDGSTLDTGTNDYATDQPNGLVGVKVAGVITGVNGINDALLDAGLTKEARDEFITEYKGTTDATYTFGGTNVADFVQDIDQLNTAIGTANSSDGTFFGNNALDAFTADTVNQFLIPSYNGFNDIGIENGKQGGYTSISNWANELQTVTAGNKTGTVNTTGTITIVDDTEGSEAISDGTTTFTWDTETLSFI